MRRTHRGRGPIRTRCIDDRLLVIDEERSAVLGRDQRGRGDPGDRQLAILDGRCFGEEIEHRRILPATVVGSRRAARPHDRTRGCSRARAGAFIAFALLSALVIPALAAVPGEAPRRFIVATVVFFVAMLSAVEFFAASRRRRRGDGCEYARDDDSAAAATARGAGGEGAERQDRVLGSGLRELPHVQGRERDGDGRAGSRHRAQGQGWGVRARVDRRPQQG